MPLHYYENSNEDGDRYNLPEVTVIPFPSSLQYPNKLLLDELDVKLSDECRFALFCHFDFMKKGKIRGGNGDRILNPSEEIKEKEKEKEKGKGDIDWQSKEQID